MSFVMCDWRRDVPPERYDPTATICGEPAPFLVDRSTDNDGPLALCQYHLARFLRLHGARRVEANWPDYRAT